MILTFLIILLALVFLNVLLLIFSCNSPDDEAIKSYKMRIRFPKQKKVKTSNTFNLAADK
jgi:hypothetical protein